MLGHLLNLRRLHKIRRDVLLLRQGKTDKQRSDHSAYHCLRMRYSRRSIKIPIASTRQRKKIDLSIIIARIE